MAKRSLWQAEYLGYAYNARHESRSIPKATSPCSAYSDCDVRQKVLLPVNDSYLGLMGFGSGTKNQSCMELQ